MRWSEEVTCKFVKLYLRHEFLWNQGHEDYKTKHKREMAYKDIINQFRNATGIALSNPELKVKLKNLKSTYSQEIAKIKQRSTFDCTYKPTIKWFADWHKCFAVSNRKHDVVTYEENADNTTLENDQTEDSHDQVWVPDNAEDNANSDPFPDDDYNIIFKLEPNDNSHAKGHNSNGQSHYDMKQKKVNQRTPSTDYSYNTFRDSVDSRSEVKDDEFDIYGKYIASQLRTMNIQKALRVQLEIQSLVSEARISDMGGKNRSN